MGANFRRHALGGNEALKILDLGVGRFHPRGVQVDDLSLRPLVGTVDETSLLQRLQRSIGVAQREAGLGAQMRITRLGRVKLAGGFQQRRGLAQRDVADGAGGEIRLRQLRQPLGDGTVTNRIGRRRILKSNRCLTRVVCCRSSKTRLMVSFGVTFQSS